MAAVLIELLFCVLCQALSKPFGFCANILAAYHIHLCEVTLIMYEMEGNVTYGVYNVQFPHKYLNKKYTLFLP